MPDKYTYPNTEVLKNKFNVRDTMLLHAYEKKYVSARLTELREKPIQGDFNLNHLQKIHEHLFQDVYTWAGKLREIDIGKVDQLDQKLHEFCPSHRIEGFAEDIAKSLKKANYLKGLDQEQFADKAAEVLGDLNTLHPFREGNGRTQREFVRELAYNAGWKLDFSDVSREQMIEASVAAMNMDYRLFKDMIKESIKPAGLELTPEYAKQIAEIKSAPDKVDRVKALPAKDIFNYFANKSLSRNEGIWDNICNTEVITGMKKAGISDQKIISALAHSPTFLGMSAIDKIIKTRTVVRNVIRNNPELQKSIGFSR